MESPDLVTEYLKTLIFSLEQIRENPKKWTDTFISLLEAHSSIEALQDSITEEEIDDEEEDEMM